MPPTIDTKNKILRFILLVVLILSCWLGGKYFHFHEDYFKDVLSQYPIVYSGLIFVLLYVVLTFFIWFTKDLLMIAGGLVFGVAGSSLLIWIAESINAVVLFYLSRKLGRDFVEEKTKGRLKNFDQRVADAGFWDMVLLRAIILVPFRFLDLGFGLTKVSFRKYILAVLIGSPFRVLMRQYFLVMFLDFVIYNTDDLMNFVLTTSWVSYLSFVYLFFVILVFVRLKKMVWG